MNNTICYPLAQLGYDDKYFITEQGQIITTANYSQPQKEKKFKVSLKTKDGRFVYRSIKPLYRKVFGREYCIDTIENLPEEIWKPIDDSGRYYISSLGRVKSCKGLNARILQPFKNKKGYLRVDIYLDRRKTYLVHQLVALAFVENDDPENKDTVDHINENKTDNTANNLRWLSRGDNVKAYYHSSKRKGEQQNVYSIEPKDS